MFESSGKNGVFQILLVGVQMFKFNSANATYFPKVQIPTAFVTKASRPTPYMRNIRQETFHGIPYSDQPQVHMVFAI